MRKKSARPFPEKLFFGVSMFTMQKSTLFTRQWESYAQNYKQRAGMRVAERFIIAVEEALKFIGQQPHACALYDVGEGYKDLGVYKFRKWNLSGFPHLILFRLRDKSTIFIEMLYAHKMDIPTHLLGDRE